MSEARKSKRTDLTQLLLQAEEGDPLAAEQLLPTVYDELRFLASSRIRKELPGQTLAATDLVHEAYLRLIGGGQSWENRSHFFAAAGEAMRRILVERARRKQRIKHGGQVQRVPMNDDLLKSGQSPDDLIAVDDLLDQFAEKHPTEAQIVKLHFFSGFSIADCAKALGIARSTAHERWRFARAWLHRELQR
ncbi:ECF-type sigma factor [Aeoliella sp. ICT_H6.2]|uniref:ECF-type sigma factor n=1 Tax=Aeoliella straminimaris TaxID=2954799 RepID=A0A9X2JI14_9BACT|nr:ECF-type sigma factor [Aeoliella straminimaris]MCO6046391.1 ECF-type sigma factor [Aeoliella straminimaris]